jgi:hypothetical protein
MEQSKAKAWITVPLPSQGVWYYDALPKGEVQIRKTNLDEESILQTEGMDLKDRLAMVLRNCTKLPDGFNYTIPGTKVSFAGHDGLTTTDRLALLVLQRQYSLSPKYSYEWRCDSCRAVTKSPINMEEDFDYITPETLAQSQGVAKVDLTEPFPVLLPDTGVTLRMRVARGGDETALERAGRKAKSLGDKNVTSANVQSIVQLTIGVDENPQWESLSFFQKELYIKSLGLTSADSTTIRMAMNDRETGVDTRVPVICSKCGAPHERSLVLGPEFFFPARI